jgi:chondroitin AC lyase
MQTNGSWTDIDYKSTAVAIWPPLDHLERIRNMSYVYLQSGQSLYLNAGLLTKIDSALTYWYKVKPTSTNWWQGTIGKQMHLNVIGILMKDYLRKTLLTQIINDLSAAPSMTGANLTDISTSVIYRGLIEGDLARVNSGLTAISNEIKISSGDGLKIDNSFHQHGAFLYNGGYGLVFLKSTTYWAEKTAKTTLAFAQPKVTLLSNMLLKGNRWMTRGITQDYGADGRGISRESASGTAQECITYATRMANVDVVNNKALVTMADRIQKGERQDVIGSRHFWKSDFSSHHRAAFYTSVKMCSKRTVGTEGGNGENLKGYWLPFGVNFILRKGNEYHNIFPIWDWGLLPGVTSPNISPFPGSPLTQQETFVGGVTDSTYGVSAMKLNIQNTSAKKAWFLFDKEWVALGTDITSTNAAEVNTTLNQTYLNTSNLLVNGSPILNGVYKYDSLKWVMNDSVAYVFLEKKPVILKAQTQSGSWYDINTSQSKTIISKDVFTLCLPHGKTPVNASYQYAIVPGISPADAADYYKNIPLSVLKNTSQIQAVTHIASNVTGVVFYQPDTLTINNLLRISVNRACIVLVRKVDNDKYAVTIADPERTQTQIVGTLYNKNNISKSSTFIMPSGDNAGKSVSATIVLPSVLNIESVNNDSFILSVYPNPSKGDFTVGFNSDNKSTYSLEITNALGEIVYKEVIRDVKGEYKKALNVGKGISGIYTLRLSNAQNQTVKKIIVL